MSNETNDNGQPALTREEEPKLEVKGPLRRNAPVLIGVAIALLVGPFVSQALRSYRGIVLEIREQKMLVGFPGDRPPEWLDAADAKVGDIVLKEMGDWQSRVVQPIAEDHVLEKLNKRYNGTYKGVIDKIIPPSLPKQPNVAVVNLDNGTTIRLELWGDHLRLAAEGMRLEKRAGSWEPELVDGGAIPTTKPEGGTTADPAEGAEDEGTKPPPGEESPAPQEPQ